MSTANKILMGAAGGDGPSDDQFNRVSFLSHFDGSNNGVNNAFDDGSSSNHTITTGLFYKIKVIILHFHFANSKLGGLHFDGPHPLHSCQRSFSGTRWMGFGSGRISSFSG